jgi:hypothetical protein
MGADLSDAMLRLPADRGKNHDPARTVSLRPFERDTVLASVKTTPLRGWRWRAKS